MMFLLHNRQVKKVGDFTEERVKSLVVALDRLDGQVKADRNGSQRDALEAVCAPFPVALRMQLPQAWHAFDGQPGTGQPGGGPVQSLDGMRVPH